MLKRLLICIVILSAAVLTLAACGSSGPSDQEKHEAAVAKKKHEEKLAAEKREKREEAEALVALQEGELCEEQLGQFLESLEDLNGRLQVGVNYNQYFEYVGDASAAYNQIPFKQLEYKCLNKVGLPSENALNAYVEGAGVWEECFEALSCEGEDPELQRKWTKAERQLNHAESGMETISLP